MPGDIGALSFDHIHMFCDSLDVIENYKELESTFNSFGGPGTRTVEEGKAAWASLGASAKEFSPEGQDFVEQCIAGLGWRVTAHYSNNNTRSYLVTSPDPNGVRFVVSAPVTHAEEDGSSAKKKKKVEDEYDHFAGAHIRRFYDNNSGRPGVATLCFQAGPGVVDLVCQKYADKHPNLSCGPPRVYGGVKIFEAYAYYAADQDVKPDEGTRIRFVERSSDTDPVLPGFESVDASFRDGSLAYSDHWVSNVCDRKQFLSTMEDVLGFQPKVDFNAGVVAAGEAIIESTVTGNTPAHTVTDKASALTNQQQIYLPINNALSTKGHVYLFIEEMGQGVQHIANRVEDIISFINTTNRTREMTGRGFSFLRIPRSYYGLLRCKDLVSAGVPEDVAAAAEKALVAAGLSDVTGVVDMTVDDAKIAAAVGDVGEHLATIQDVVKRARYVNVFNFLREHVSEENYLKIVRNKILVDIQGNDVLYQIFTSNILQRNKGEEAPFLEFIQRVCSEKTDACGKAVPIRPGCGGFGIRNFLTLFLSIEVSKAMLEVEAASAAGDNAKLEKSQKMVLIFTDQLNESNPILTDISDAMTAEADALLAAGAATSEEEASKHNAEAEKWRAKKEDGQTRLQVCSAKYKDLMISA